jgi:argininosuccinate lyase
MKKPRQPRMWGGRFKKGPAVLAERYSRSLHFDSRLAPYDIEVSSAHARALRKAGILSEKEMRLLLRGLKSLGKELLDHRADFSTGEEDIHTWVENRLRERVGETADKLHTGRSRNDQVVQDFRLFLRDQTIAALKALKGLKGSLLDLAEACFGEVTAGHTHLQPAQPVLLSHHLLAYFEMFQRDSERFRDLLPRLAVLTMGSGALAGTTIPLDRPFLARQLGLRAVSKNSMDAVSDRDFAVEFTAASSLAMVHLSRLSEELILWSHPALGWAEISEEYCTGSSLMPQKRNPDMPELARGKTGRVVGHLMGLLTLIKGLPLAYNRDLQEDKEAVFDTVDTLLSSLDVMAALLPGVSFRSERLRESAEAGLSFATDLAEHLSLRGVPFRQAHAAVGKLVRWCLEENRLPGEITLSDLQRFSPRFDQAAVKLISVDASVRAKKVPGGTSPTRVRAALKSARKQNH